MRFSFQLRIESDITQCLSTRSWKIGRLGKCKIAHIRIIPVGALTGADVGGPVGVPEFRSIRSRLGATCVEVGV
jgi:hypothetical protein